MAIVQTGSTLKFDGSIITSLNTGTVSSTITVPADAEMVLVSWSGYSTTTNFYSGGSMTFTKGGVDTAMTAVAGGETSVGWNGGLFYLLAPDTGSNKTLKWDWLGTGGSNDSGNFCSVTFWKGNAASSVLRDSDLYQSGSNTPYGPTKTLTAQSGDLIIASVTAYCNSTTGSIDTWSNLSALASSTDNWYDAFFAWATGSPSGNTTVTASTDTNLDDGMIIAGVFKPASSGSYSVSQTDSATASDSSSTLATLVATASESGSATSTQTTLATLVASQTDSGSSSDTVSSIATLVASQTDSGSASETSSTLAVLVASQTDSGSSADTISSLATLVADQVDSGSLADTVSSLAVLIAEQVDSGSALDSSDSSLGANTYDVTQTDSGSLSDDSSTLAVLIATQTETGTTDDVSSTLAVLVASQTETSVATDTSTTLAVLTESLTESGTFSETSSALVSSADSSSDILTLLDTQSSLASLIGSVVETGSASDTLTNTAVLVGDISESSFLYDLIDSDSPSSGTSSDWFIHNRRFRRVY